MRLFSAFLCLVLFLVVPGELIAKSPTGLPKKMAILPTIFNVEKKALNARIDTTAWFQIEKNEAYNAQLLNYYFIAQKQPRYNLQVQPVSQTNELLQNAGISYELLAQYSQKDLAAILGVDLIFYGINHRVADNSTPEELLAKNLAINLASGIFLPIPGAAALAKVKTIDAFAKVKATDKPLTTFHYLLYDGKANSTIWHYKDETKRPDNYYMEIFRKYLINTFPI